MVFLWEQARPTSLEFEEVDVAITHQSCVFFFFFLRASKAIPFRAVGVLWEQARPTSLEFEEVDVAITHQSCVFFCFFFWEKARQFPSELCGFFESKQGLLAWNLKGSTWRYTHQSCVFFFFFWGQARQFPSELVFLWEKVRPTSLEFEGVDVAIHPSELRFFFFFWEKARQFPSELWVFLRASKAY